MCLNGDSATGGTPFDCTGSGSSNICQQCDNRGYVSCANNQCRCKQNVQGSRCDYCREGTFNLQSNNSLGCDECFCSGATTSCQSGRWFREELPMFIFDDEFVITDRENRERITEGVNADFAENQVTYHFSADGTFFWSLPSRFLGNQILSYGGHLIINQNTEGSGEYIRDHDVIIRGNGITLVWERQWEQDGVCCYILLSFISTKFIFFLSYEKFLKHSICILKINEHLYILNLVRFVIYYPTSQLSE